MRQASWRRASTWRRSRASCAVGRNVELYADVGNPVSLIAKVTRKQGIDLIAMATHGRSGLARLALGSVTTETLHQAGVPLLLVRRVAMHQPRTAANATTLAAAPSARKAVPIADLHVNDAVTAPAGAIMGVNRGLQVAVGEAARLVLYVTNVGPSAGVVTVLAGDPRCAPHPATSDLHIRILPGSGRLVGPLGASRLVQQDGTLWLDFTLDLAGTIVAYRLPRDTWGRGPALGNSADRQGDWSEVSVRAYRAVGRHGVFECVPESPCWVLAVTLNHFVQVRILVRQPGSTR